MMVNIVTVFMEVGIVVVVRMVMMLSVVMLIILHLLPTQIQLWKICGKIGQPFIQIVRKAVVSTQSTGDKEKEGGFEAAKAFALENIQSLPSTVHWKVYLEMADLAKRENHFNQARKYYQEVNKIQPYAGKGWLEFAKMEEESGNLTACTSILNQGLNHCPQNENLLVKGIKHYEKLNDIRQARVLLSRLANVPIEQSWRTIMEGGLLEARQGNIAVAREIFHYLITNVSHYGPIYVEAVRLEIKMEEYGRALRLVERGLLRIPTYGPLYFLALKLDERLKREYNKRVMDALPRLSKELVWKIWLELAQIEHRQGNLVHSNKAYVHAICHCPKNLKWKVWFAGARTELCNKNYEVSRKLLARALADVPVKMKATVLVEQARFEEHQGNLEQARLILNKAKKETVHEWKVFLESVLLEIRANNLEAAMQQVEGALKEHNSTGRLWAILIQLTHLMNLNAPDVSLQTTVLKKALDTVPKSGEVWCEGARIALHLNLLDLARKYLDFAIQFTPQYGDSFIEYMRLELLECMDNLKEGDDVEVALGKTKAVEKLERLCINAEPTYGVCWSYCRDSPLDSSKKCLKNARDKLLEISRQMVSQQYKESSNSGNFNSITPTSENSKEGEDKLKEERMKIIFSKLDIAAYFLGRGRSIHEEPEEFRFRAIFN
eukprot:TRINITY_DN12471_c0_g1_i5.p1 TRINITY_DN12471_c0_g1~~TRINITY_DN12471_c0_g1_i5.p1  ORF type:complete len:664 (-),score=182.42 TRINITY_DN12471_c0_g1_i5:166-2157(-)